MRVFLDRPLVISFIIGLFLSPFTHFYYLHFPVHSIAHRGASAYAPENTMSAFYKAIDLGFDYIEMDVRLSKDNELVVIHDLDVNRTTNGEGFVHKMTVNELKQLDAGSWFSREFSGERIPLLREVLETFGGKIGLMIEIKSSQKGKKIADHLSLLLDSFFEKGLDPNTVKVQSFHISEIKRFHELCPEVSTGILFGKPVHLLHLASYRDFASFIAIDYKYLSKALIKQARFFNYEIYTWDVRHKKQIQFIQKQNVHGIISNEKQTLTEQSV